MVLWVSKPSPPEIWKKDDKKYRYANVSIWNNENITYQWGQSKNNLILALINCLKSHLIVNIEWWKVRKYYISNWTIEKDVYYMIRHF